MGGQPDCGTACGRWDGEFKAKQEILDDERLTVARRRAEKAEQEQQVLEPRPTSCRSRPADVPSDFCTPTGEDQRAR